MIIAKPTHATSFDGTTRYSESEAFELGKLSADDAQAKNPFEEDDESDLFGWWDEGRDYVLLSDEDGDSDYEDRLALDTVNEAQDAAAPGQKP